jgi:hypothetical protein
MDPDAVYDPSGQTVRGKLDAINQQDDELKTLGTRFRNVLPTLPEPDLILYFERSQLFGEEAAQRWVLTKYAPAQ